MFKKALVLFLIASQAFATPNGSQGSAASAALSGQGLSEIVNGSSHILQAGSELTVLAVRTLGKVTLITLQAAGQSATVTLRVATHVSGHALFATGQVIQVMTTGAGTLLINAGNVLAFLPTQLGKNLIYSSAL